MYRFLVVIEKTDRDYSAYSPDLSVSEFLRNSETLNYGLIIVEGEYNEVCNLS